MNTVLDRSIARYERWWMEHVCGGWETDETLRIYSSHKPYVPAPPQPGYWFRFSEQMPPCEPGTRRLLWIMWEDGTQRRGWWQPSVQDGDDAPVYWMMGLQSINGR